MKKIKTFVVTRLLAAVVGVVLTTNRDRMKVRAHGDGDALRFLRGARGLVALAVVAAAFVTAGPAGAADSPPVDKNGKKYCPIKSPDTMHGTAWFPDGSTVTVTEPKGFKTTFRCQDGVWVVVYRFPGGGTRATIPFGSVGSYSMFTVEYGRVTLPVLETRKE